MSRELPHSTEAEQSILGAMMIYPSVTSVVYDQGWMCEISIWISISVYSLP